MTKGALPERTSDPARYSLFRRFSPKITAQPQLDRSFVSFQGNKGIPFFNWFKFKEGFSAQLVRYLIEQVKPSRGVLLDPFAGTGVTLFVGRSQGWDAIGIEVLPVGVYTMETRLSAEEIKPAAFQRLVESLANTHWADYFDPRFALRHIPITEGAFSAETERAIAGYLAYCRRFVRNPHLRRLLEFGCFAVLESVSYTRKDGQYLRWDHRAGKPRVGPHFDKGPIPDFDSAIHAKLRDIANDLAVGGDVNPAGGDLIDGRNNGRRGYLDLRFGSCLEILPQMRDDSVDLVITSPPYCNRYDYTRSYALELVYLGYDADQVKALRQAMLSCTVENQTKVGQLAEQYSRPGRKHAFERVERVFKSQSALQEILAILERLAAQGELNNSNIPNMVRNYFFEMCFVICELSRVLRRGGSIAMVNDNVRYAGEEVPVDLILSDFAERFGLRVAHIWTLPRGKGNSSQQMGLHGRSELRKCVYVWQKSQ